MVSNKVNMKESIDDFETECAVPQPMACFEGYYPSPENYMSMMTAYSQFVDYANGTQVYNFTKINNRNWLVTTHDNSDRKAGANREYTTFFGDKMVSVFVNMSMTSDAHSADAIFADVTFN
jgi:hypothetical protein